MFDAAVADVATDDESVGTGIQELESSVFGFLYSHAGVLKLLAIVDDLTRMLSQVGHELLLLSAAITTIVQSFDNRRRPHANYQRR